MTITRGSLSASRQVAETVGREVGCDIVTREEVINHARKYGLEETGMADTDFMEKQRPHLWDRHAAQRRLYLIYLRASLMDFAVKGDVIYLGHMGQFILSDIPKLLRIRVDTSLEFRIRVGMERAKLSEEEAREYIKNIDATRKNWVKFLYGVDYDSPLLYDIVLNLEHMSLESAAEIIACAVKRPEWAPTEETKKIVKNVHVSSIVSAHLARSPRTRGMELDVDCDAQSGRSTIRGMSPLIGAVTWKNDIRDVVLAVEGISEVEIVDLR
jgi:cytidylate kinase